MKIIQQTSTLLQFQERGYKDLFVSVLGTCLIMALPVWRVWVSYSEFQYTQLKCEVASSSRSEPCTLTKVKDFPAMVNSEPVKSVRVDVAQDADSGTTTSTLILLTKKGDYRFPHLRLSNEDVKLYAQRIETMLKSGRVLGTQLEPFTLEEDVRSSSLIWGVVWCLITFLFAVIFIWMILSTPTYINWKFDQSDDSIVGNFYQFSRRVDHDRISLSQVQHLKWTSQTSISRDDSGEETKKLTFCVELVLRSGEVIPLVTPLWSNYWTFKNSEAFVTTISHFLDVEVPELSDVPTLTPFKERNTYSAYLQEQAQLKKQRSEIRTDA